ncbi:predicted protein [Arabidopsis lyrata subsp. lyrata]|uniref:Predicted protein n=1 Tax=Arabidopsis lyrata subsp. lyrata TaxID=81972 RepID=D7L5F0_ARALL|nr:predicted protein [Arabidopsis lyrata subsp. lyrata]
MEKQEEEEVKRRRTRTKNSNHPRVLTLGSAQESWRSIKGSFEHYSYTHGQCINGVLYYESFLKYDSAHSFIGKLASLVYSTNMDAFISLWVLEDAESHEWSFRIFSLPFPLDDPISHTLLILTGVTEAGEFVYAPTTLENPFHALYFDPQRNSFRRVIYEGIADNEFRRRNGLGNKPLRRLHIFPNHVGSLMSF